MMWCFSFKVLTISTLLTAVAAQISPGIYRIGSVEFAQLLLTQSGSTIAGFGGNINGNPNQTWFIQPTTSTSGKVSIQNVGTLQYLAVSGTPANGSLVVPSIAPFEWTLQSRGIAVNGFFVTAFAVAGNSFILTEGPPELPTQQWSIGVVTPLPFTYRLWNIDTNTYLTASRFLPSALTVQPLDGSSAAQVWTLAGTVPGSQLGTLASFATKGFIAISNGTIATFSTAQAFDFRWQFSFVGSADKLANFDAPSPNVISISDNGQVVLNGSKQAWTFVPVDIGTVA